MKKHYTVFLCSVVFFLLLGAVCPVLAVETETRLYNVYGDHMLFLQNADTVFAGVAAPGTALEVTLTDETGAVVRTAQSAAGEDGAFSFSFPAPAGSYDPYTVTLYANGAPVRTLSDVVFGELWLSFGQSNMEYILGSTPEGREMVKVLQMGSHNLRVLQVPHPLKDGEFCTDALPQTDAQDCYWFTGDTEEVYTMSACAYFFAQKLMAELDVPVGILNTARGGSAISTWLSREAIESHPEIKNALVAHGAYIPLEDYDKGGLDYFKAMTGIYNSKIAPLTNFRIAGGIWYQGETDFMTYDDPDFYAQLFRLLQESYTEAFSHENGSLPILFTQFMTWRYRKGPYAETAFNDVFTRLAVEKPESRSEVVIYDLVSDYYPECGSDHPMTKKPIGERMTNCAMGLVYGGGQPTSAPARTAMNARGGSVYVTFSNVGDGLVCSGDALRGFAVYGAQGVCVSARAEIVSPNTVRVWCDSVPAPVGATYAVNSLSPNANLWSSFGGAPYLPAASFGASDPAVTKYFDDAEWLRCDTLSAWQNSSSSGYTDVWTARGAALSVSSDAVEGGGSLALKARNTAFTVSAPFSESGTVPPLLFDSLDSDFSRYGTLSVRLKNTGSTAVLLTGLRLYKTRAVWFSPLVQGSDSIGTTIPADGAWHTIVFDLDSLRMNGVGQALWSNDALEDLAELRLCFSGADASLSIDDFRFTPEKPDGGNAGAALQRLLARARAVLEAIKAWVLKIVYG